MGVRLGLRRGRDDASAMPSPPRVRYRSTHFLAVAGEHWNRLAARRSVQPCSMTKQASFPLALGVRLALEWVT
jgi:hypothetical protein